MSSRILKILLLLSPLLLVACGPDWEPQRVSGIVPYTQERTAGTGVAYVRAKMLPEKNLKVEMKEQKEELKAAQPEAIKSAEPVFKENQKK